MMGKGLGHGPFYHFGHDGPLTPRNCFWKQSAGTPTGASPAYFFNFSEKNATVRS